MFSRRTASGSVSSQADSSQADSGRGFPFGAVLVICAAIGFSAKGILIKLAYQAGVSVDAITLMALRMGMSLPVFVIAAIWVTRREPEVRLGTKDWGGVILLGFFGYYLASLLDFWGLEFISAGLERLILYTYPTLVVLLAAMLERRLPSRRESLALLIGYLGVAMVVWNDVRLFGDQPAQDIYFGALLVFLSAVSFAIFLTGNGMLIKRLGSKRFTALTMTMASVYVGVHFGLSHPLEQLDQPASVLWLAALMALVSTVLPSFMMNAGIQRVGPSKAALMMTIGPVSTLLLAAVFLDEPVTLVQLGGTAMVLGGVWIVAKRN